MKPEAKRILLLTTAYRPLVGGSEVAIEQVTKRLPNIFFDLLTPRLTATARRQEQESNVFIQRLGWGTNFDKWWFLVSGFWRARQMLRQHPYSAIHVWQASYAGGVAWLLSWLSHHPPIILTLQEGKQLERQNWPLRKLRGMILGRIDRATAISHYLKKYIFQFNHRSAVLVIPNGVDRATFAQEYSYGDLAYLADQLGIMPGDKVIIHIGRLVKKNGLANLMRAAAHLQDSNPAWAVKLLLVGEGPERETLARLALNLGIGKSVIFPGQISYYDLPKYLKLSQVFARPSFSEGLGNAFLEAMAAGIPVVGSASGGIPDFLKDGRTGLLCDPRDPEDIADNIQRLLTDENLRHRVVQAGRELVKSDYDWDKIAPRYAEIYPAI